MNPNNTPIIFPVQTSNNKRAIIISVVVVSLILIVLFGVFSLISVGSKGISVSLHDAERKTYVLEVQNYVEMYYIQNGIYPKLSDLYINNNQLYIGDSRIFKSGQDLNLSLTGKIDIKNNKITNCGSIPSSTNLLIGYSVSNDRTKYYLCASLESGKIYDLYTIE
ncbi:MAG: hypothetical protein WCJ19_03950 [bacterium]